MSARAHAAGSARPDFLARFLSAVPLLVVYFGLAALYAWQASRRAGADDLHGRARAHAARPRRSPRRASRRGAASRTGSRRSSRTLLAPVWWLELGDGVVGGREAHPRPRDDRDRLPRVRARADGRSEVVRARRGRRLGRRAGARVLADPRRGAARVSGLDDRALADRARARAADAGAALARRVRHLGRRCAHAHAARGPRSRCWRSGSSGSPGSPSRCGAGAPSGRRGTGSGAVTLASASPSRSRPRWGTARTAWRNTMLVYKDRHLRVRELGVRRARDRHRRASGARSGSRRSRVRERRRAIRGRARSSRRASPR